MKCVWNFHNKILVWRMKRIQIYIFSLVLTFCALARIDRITHTRHDESDEKRKMKNVLFMNIVDEDDDNDGKIDIKKIHTSTFLFRSKHLTFSLIRSLVYFCSECARAAIILIFLVVRGFLSPMSALLSYRHII